MRRVRPTPTPLEAARAWLLFDHQSPIVRGVSDEQSIASLAALIEAREQKAERRIEEAEAKQTIDERQCDHMTDQAAKFATALTRAQAVIEPALEWVTYQGVGRHGCNPPCSPECSLITAIDDYNAALDREQPEVADVANTVTPHPIEPPEKLPPEVLRNLTTPGESEGEP